MKHISTKPILFFILTAGLILLTQPLWAVTVLNRAPNTMAYLGDNYQSLEFENPLSGFERVRGYRVLEWLDADRLISPPYDDWNSVGAPGSIGGNADEVWLLEPGQAISTNTTIPGSLLSIHLIGGPNSGRTDVYVDGQIVAQLDMFSGFQETALLMVRTKTYSVHNIEVFNSSTAGPSYVRVLGACVLDRRPKWFYRYWYLDARIRFTFTPYYVTVPTGFWGGWYWWRYPTPGIASPYYPYAGPVGWYWRYSWRYPYWRYWNYWPYFRYYKPWWSYWRWRGWPYFWGFRDRLTYRYYGVRPRITYWWSWYWDPDGQGNCIELVTMANENDPGGRKIRPVDPDLPENLELDPSTGHAFEINEGSASGNFSPLQFIPVGQLQNYLSSQIPDMEPDDVDAFMSSDIVQRLLQNTDDPATELVGIQHCSWQHPAETIPIEIVALNLQSVEPISVKEGESLEYGVCLFDEVGTGNIVPVEVKADNDRVDLGNGPGQPVLLEFDASNWNQPQMINVMVPDDMQMNGDMPVRISHWDLRTPPENPHGAAVEVLVKDDESCPDQAHLPADVNRDGVVNVKDVAGVGRDWLMDCGPTGIGD